MGRRRTVGAERRGRRSSRVAETDVTSAPVAATGQPPAVDGIEAGSRLHAVTGWSPAGRAARNARRAARGIEAEHRRRLMLARRAELEALRQVRRSQPYLPAGGECGPMAGRSYRRLRVVPHRATSEVFAGAYPFLAEEGLGSCGMLIGQDAWSGAGFCYDPSELEIFNTDARMMSNHRGFPASGASSTGTEG